MSQYDTVTQLTHSPYSYKDFINIYSNTQLRNLKFKKKFSLSEREMKERDSVCVCVIHVINYKKKIKRWVCQ